MKLVRFRVLPGKPSAQLEPTMSTGTDEVATDTGLAREWPREPDASAKDAQVGKPGGPPALRIEAQ